MMLDNSSVCLFLLQIGPHKSALIFSSGQESLGVPLGGVVPAKTSSLSHTMCKNVYLALRIFQQSLESQRFQALNNFRSNLVGISTVLDAEDEGQHSDINIFIMLCP